MVTNLRIFSYTNPPLHHVILEFSCPDSLIIHITLLHLVEVPPPPRSGTCIECLKSQNQIRYGVMIGFKTERIRQLNVIVKLSRSNQPRPHGLPVITIRSIVMSIFRTIMWAETLVSIYRSVMRTGSIRSINRTIMRRVKSVFRTM